MSMKSLTFAAVAAVFLPAQTFAAGAPPPGPGETHVPYEMGMFDIDSQTQSAGVHLALPGDRVRYTYLITDELFTDPEYELDRAMLGVHILDKDADEDGADDEPEWGAIHLDGAAGTTVVGMGVTATMEGDEGLLTDLVEMQSDSQIPSGLPPYIYNVTAQVMDDGKLVLEVINLNENGGEDTDVDYGDFNMLRGGLHLYYKKAGT